MTNYTSVILGKNSLENALQQVSIIPLQNQSIVALVCTDKGIVQNKTFVLADNISVSEVVKTCEIINKMLVGTPIDEVSRRLEFILYSLRHLVILLVNKQKLFMLVAKNIC